LHELRDIGHGHHVNIVDDSYDIPRGAKMIRFPGSAAEALLGVVRLVPVEGSVEIMVRDDNLAAADPNEEHVSARARDAFGAALAQAEAEGIELETEGFQREGEDGFYDRANNAPNSLFIRAVDPLPFACAALTVGHAQRTE
jgi:L-fucose mutarotase/ribose pyranase (RbsD/FucU family)